MIQYHISSENKINFKLLPNRVRSDIITRGGKIFTSYIHPDTIFITAEGVFDLFMKSSKPLAKAMKRWLIYDVIPSILRKGEYSIIPAPIAQSTVPALVIAEPCPRMTICHNPKGFPVSSVKSAIYILNLPF